MTQYSGEEILDRLKSLGDPAAVEGMDRFGIRTTRALGVSMPQLQEIAREIGKQHPLALTLWNSAVHEARILACLIDEPDKVTEDQMEGWAKEFDSWDLCDQCCSKLFDRTPFAYRKAKEWAVREEEFVKRAGFVLMATLAVHDKKAPDSAFLDFFPLIEQETGDDRNFVKKAVNWALRQIGKRNSALYPRCISLAERIKQQEAPAARWVAADALRELTGEKIRQRMRAKDH